MASSTLCESCFLKEKSTIAVKICTDCDEQLCEECSVNHLGFKAFKLHKLIQLTLISRTMNTFDNHCSSHDIALDFFCTHHDTVCCRMCIPETHQLCKHVVPLEVASKDIRNSALLTEISDELDNITITLHTLLYSRKASLEKLDNSSILQEIVKIKSRLIKHIDDLEGQLTDKYTKAKGRIELELKMSINNILEKMSTTEDRKKDLKFLKEHGTTNPLFLALRTYAEDMNSTETEINEMVATCKDTEIYFEPHALYTESLGTISQISKPCDIQYIPRKMKQAQVQPHIRITPLTTFSQGVEFQPYEGKNSNLSDIEVTKDNKLLICNFNDQHPKVFIYTNSTIFENEMKLSSKPWRISCIPDTCKAVVTLPDEKSAQIINTANITKEEKIKLDFEPMGITASASRIYIGGFGQVNIFDTKGTFHKKIPLLRVGYVYFISLNKCNSEIVCRVTDDVLCFDLDGNMLYKYKVFGMAGITIDGQGDVYAADYHLNYVHRLSPDGKFKSEKLRHYLRLPHSMTFNSGFNKLFIINNDHMSIKIFACS